MWYASNCTVSWRTSGGYIRLIGLTNNWQQEKSWSCCCNCPQHSWSLPFLVWPGVPLLWHCFMQLCTVLSHTVTLRLCSLLTHWFTCSSRESHASYWQSRNIAIYIWKDWLCRPMEWLQTYLKEANLWRKLPYVKHTGESHNSDLSTF